MSKHINSEDYLDYVRRMIEPYEPCYETPHEDICGGECDQSEYNDWFDDDDDDERESFDWENDEDECEFDDGDDDLPFEPGRIYTDIISLNP